MSDEIANLFASRFISRRDVKAVQHADGSWMPATANGKRDGDRLPWTRNDLLAHIAGEQTYGHYMLNTDDTTKLFAFDIDLAKNDEKAGFSTQLPAQAMDPENLETWEQSFHACDAIAAWHNRSHPARDFMKLQFRQVAHRLAVAVERELEIPVAVAYSGSKGVHVYGFLGATPAVEAIEGAQIVLDSLGDWKPSRGNNFFRCENQDPIDGFPNLTIEVFPKQQSLDGKDLGNLMRLPLGRNKKSTDPTFFIDMTAPMNALVPMDPTRALVGTSLWGN